MKGRIREWLGDTIGWIAIFAIPVVGLIIGQGITG